MPTAIFYGSMHIPFWPLFMRIQNHSKQSKRKMPCIRYARRLKKFMSLNRNNRFKMQKCPSNNNKNANVHTQSSIVKTLNEMKSNQKCYRITSFYNICGYENNSILLFNFLFLFIADCLEFFYPSLFETHIFRWILRFFCVKQNDICRRFFVSILFCTRCLI